MPSKTLTRLFENRTLKLETEDIVSVALVVVALLALGFGSFGIYKSVKTARETHDTLCIFKQELVEVRNASSAVLTYYPDAETIYSIPRKVIEDSVNRQTKSIESLQSLDCSSEDR